MNSSAAISPRDWTNLYEATKRRIVARRQQGQGFPPVEARNVQESIATLADQLRAMAASPLEYELAQSEIARKQTQIEGLQRQMMAVPSSSVGGGGGGVITSSVAASAASSSSSSATLNPMATSDRGLVQRQKDIMRLQDEMIEDIGRGVDRLHNQATTIGEETKTQNRMLDDLEFHVDDTAEALQAEARHAHEVKEKSATCGMYICIAVEVIVLLILIFLMTAT